MGLFTFIAAASYASHLTRRVERSVAPSRSWVAVQLSERTRPYGFEVDDGATGLYLAVMAPTFVVVMMLVGVVLAPLSLLGAFATLIVAGVAGHSLGMYVCNRVVDEQILAKLGDDR